jgi:ParB/RepB/Spo0J family partition protein
MGTDGTDATSVEEESRVRDIDSTRHNVLSQYVAIESVKATGINPRRDFDEARLAELAASIGSVGIVEPLVVRPGRCLTDVCWELVCGERRLRAAVMAGLTEVPIVVRELDDQEAAELAIIENIQRADLNPMEVAAGYQRLSELGWKQKEIAGRVGCSQSNVANTLRLLDLPEPVREAVGSGKVSQSAGEALLKWRDYPGVLAVVQARALTGVIVKAIEDPFSYGMCDEMERAGAIRRLRDGLDKSGCARCADRRKGDWHGDICLNPACHDAKRLEWRAEMDRQARETYGKGLDDSGNGTPLYTIPTGCRKDCEHRVQGIRDGELRETCLDRKCYNWLESAKHRAGKVDQKAGLEEKLARGLAVLDQVADTKAWFRVMDRLVAMIVFEIVNKCTKGTLKLVTEKLGVELDCALFGTGWDADKVRARRDALAAISHIQLLLMTHEIMLREETRQAQTNEYITSTSLLDWWLAGAGESGEQSFGGGSGAESPEEIEPETSPPAPLPAGEGSETPEAVEQPNLVERVGAGSCAVPGQRASTGRAD